MANEPDVLVGSPQGLIQPFLMIIISEIGDNTFLITAILAMRHSRMPVFAGAFVSLIIMSILSSALGHLLPTLIPRRWTQMAASVLFFAFGIKMSIEAVRMKSGSEKMKEEMREAEEEIEDDGALQHDDTRLTTTADTFPLDDMERGGRVIQRSDNPDDAVAPQLLQKGSRMKGARKLCNFCLGPVFVQSFVLTFLGEWGDRSQIATIALGAAHNVYLVALGTIVGHGLCTALAVIGGKYISTKVSIKHVTFGGALLFLVFGVMYMYEAFDVSPIPDPVSGDAPVPNA